MNDSTPDVAYAPLTTTFSLPAYIQPQFPPQGHLEVGRAFFGAMRSPEIRPMSTWAEQEIVVPTGPYANTRYRISRQPYTRLWFEAFDSGYWYEFAGTGPSQSGKTLTFFTIPICYYLLERKETVILCAPTKEIAQDKLDRDIWPIILKTRYAHLLPNSSKITSDGLLTFKHGPSIKVMTAGGRDKSRAHFTARVLVFTEVDGMATAQETSDEANPIEQILARARSETRSRRVIIKECTVTYEKGHIWDTIHNTGSAGKIYMQCKYCLRWVSPEREQLQGWQQAENEIEVEEKTCWTCPACSHAWSEADRMSANANLKIVHKGQQITDDGDIEGPLPPTRTFGFRFNPFQNMLLTAADIGIDEFRGARSEDEEDAAKKLSQFVWSLPYEPPGEERIKLDIHELRKRTSTTVTQGLAPHTTQWISVGIDVGMYRCHWVVVAWTVPERIGVVIDYGRLELEMMRDGKRYKADALGFEMVFKHCINTFRNSLLEGYARANSDELLIPDAFMIDSRWQGETPDVKTIYNTLKDWRDKRWHALQGFSQTQYDLKKYSSPNVRNKNVVRVGHYYHEEYLENDSIRVIKADADVWKAIVHRRLAGLHDNPGSIVLFQSKESMRHETFWKHMLSEEQVKRFEPIKGRKLSHELLKSTNHYLDALSYACIGGHYCGFVVNPQNEKKRPKNVKRPGLNEQLLSIVR